jgi:hypothetical protein
MIRFLIYPLITPAAFALAFTINRWEKLSSELVTINFASLYALIFLPSLIVAAVDHFGLKRKTESRLLWCTLTMLGVTVVPFVLLAPGIRFEESAMAFMLVAAIVATTVCYSISNYIQPTYRPFFPSDPLGGRHLPQQFGRGEADVVTEGTVVEEGNYKGRKWRRHGDGVVEGELLNGSFRKFASVDDFARYID